MAIYTVSITQGVYFDHGCESVGADDGMVSGLAQDLEMVVGRIRVTLKKPGTKTQDALAGRVVTTSEQICVLMATRAMFSHRDIDQSNGKIRIGDRKFRMAAADLDFEPQIGMTLIVDGATRPYEVVAVDHATLGAAWLVWCRG